MATKEEIQIGKLFRHKSGKLYKVDASYPEVDQPRWDCDWSIDESGKSVKTINHDAVYCTQWQVNEKWPLGRPYQAARCLKLKDLTAE